MNRYTVAVTFFLMVAACTPSGEEKNKYDASSEDRIEHISSPQQDMIAANEEYNTEEYNRIHENAYHDPQSEPLSTFSIDVDNAAYSNVRRFLTQNSLPPSDAVRIEEMINYFDYDYPEPKGEHPFAVVAEVADCPWNTEHRLVHIGLQGKSADYTNTKPGNYVFLIDVSGSMEPANKLPLVKQSLKMLLDELNERDRIALVVYAGNAGLVLPSTYCREKDEIEDAIDKLEAGGSTAGGEGMMLAYKVAKDAYIQGGNNRVILCTDGDFNVGVSSAEELVRFVEQKRKEDTYLTICGYGMGNYKDGRMEDISNAGNGNYFYIDNIQEAKKVFVTEMRANMFAIAKDVKIQVEFNPAVVSSYRLIGYEDRVMNKEDFNDDSKDADELGAGHTVTALYEVVPKGSFGNTPKVDPLKYDKEKINITAGAGEMMTIKLRYKPIHSDESKKLEVTLTDRGRSLSQSSDDFKFSAAVAGFGMLLRNSEHKGSLTYEDVIKLAQKATINSTDKYKSEFISLVETASLLQLNK